MVVNQDDRYVDLDDAIHTENTRASYPLSHIPNTSENGMAGHPKNVFFLTADAFGVLPPISKLTPEQAQYHFLAGYTAKVAGTEKGLGSEPQATFSACFGAPFMVHHPAEKVETHNVDVWLINTGWTGGAFGEGHRMKLAYTRAMIRAALNGELDDVETVPDPVFGVQVPTHVPGVPSDVLNPRGTWKDPEAYDRQASKLAKLFHENFKQFEDRVSEGVREAAPKA